MDSPSLFPQCHPRNEEASSWEAPAYLLRGASRQVRTPMAWVPGSCKQPFQNFLLPCTPPPAALLIPAVVAGQSDPSSWQPPLKVQQSHCRPVCLPLLLSLSFLESRRLGGKLPLGTSFSGVSQRLAGASWTLPDSLPGRELSWVTPKHLLRGLQRASYIVDTQPINHLMGEKGYKLFLRLV